MNMSNVLDCNMQVGDGLNFGFYDNQNCWNDWRDWYPKIYTNYYPVYLNNQSNLEKAFKIVQKLIEKGIVKDIKVEEFIKLTNEISEII